MLVRLLLGLPVLLLFSVTGVVFMAASAPRTWASHWSAPQPVLREGGQGEYGAISVHGRWDLLWVDDASPRVIYSPAEASAGWQVLDSGDVSQPSLTRSGRFEMGVWIHNHNGSTDLMGALLRPGSPPIVSTLLHSPQPIEHPYAFRGADNAIDLVFSWQKYGNFDVFLMSLPAGQTRPSLLVRLTRARYYSFYPRAVTDASGTIHLVHLESCCQQQVWNIVYGRYNEHGRRLGSERILYRIEGYADRVMASQWAEDMTLDPAGHVWGAVAGDRGALVFEASQSGRILIQPRPVDLDSYAPRALALAVGSRDGYLFWEQPFDLGTYLDSQHFDSRLHLKGPAERVVYEAAMDTDPHASMAAAGPVVVWEAVAKGVAPRFEQAAHRGNVQPTLAQRLGLGLGNPWEGLAILLISAVGVAAIATTANVLVVFALSAIGLVALRPLQSPRSKWPVFAFLLTAALFVVFVTPGVPGLLLLVTMPSMGLSMLPFGLLASVGVLLFTLWMGTVAMRHVEDLYRGGLLVVFGIFFFAFIEAIVFVQQRLGYI